MNSRKKISGFLLQGMTALYFILSSVDGSAEQVSMKITHQYLNIPIGHEARMRLMQLLVNGKMKREFPVQIAEDSIGYWIYIDVSEFKGQTIKIDCPSSLTALKRVYQADTIDGSDSLYRESNRPQFHFTVKRGWSNDINGPVYYNGQYHLFWQSFPFGLIWNTGFMYWGHAISKDLLHWEELPPALMLDSLGSPWSGTAVVDKNNDGGWGKDALVLFYTAFDRVSNKQVQCIAYSNDNAKTFTRIKGNPVIDSNWELQTTQTRDPKVFWYEPTKQWVMVLFEKDGMSFYNSTNLRQWKRQSHFEGLHECPDFFELPVDGDSANSKWVLHGGSSDYFVGTFDGRRFIPETPRLHYAEGTSERRGDLLYAAQTFTNMPGGRRVQVAWGRIDHEGMPFTQMMLFPTEFSLKNTAEGVRLMATPIKEIEQLHGAAHEWNNPPVSDANKGLKEVRQGPVHVVMNFSLEKENRLALRYNGNELINLTGNEFPQGDNTMELLIDKTVAEIFINHGQRYIIRNLGSAAGTKGLEFDSENYGPQIHSLKVYEMQSIWNAPKP